MRVRVVDERKELIREPCVVRPGDWTLERYLREAPEHGRWEFARREVVVYSPVSAEPQRWVVRLSRIPAGYCEARNSPDAAGRVSG